MNERVYTSAAASFEAARHIPGLPEGHRAGRLHGHGFQVRVRALLPPDWAPFPGAESDALSERLRAVVAPLDYALLNEHLPVPTDAELARWLWERLELPGLERISLRSAPGQGVTLDATCRVGCWRRFRFEAAHQLPNVPAGHPCGRMHGHGFEVILHAGAGTEPELDGERLESAWAPLQAEVHHACLNTLPGLENPTSERLAAWIWQRLHRTLPALSWVTVYETASAGCHYQGTQYRIWKERLFDSALSLRRAPADDSRHRLHGHSYRIRLHLRAPLDAVMGWTVDYGEVKARFEPVYRALDHRRLDALAGLDDADPASLLRWMRTVLAGRLPALERIDLEQTPGCGAVLYWGAADPLPPD